MIETTEINQMIRLPDPTAGERLLPFNDYGNSIAVHNPTVVSGRRTSFIRKYKMTIP